MSKNDNYIYAPLVMSNDITFRGTAAQRQGVRLLCDLCGLWISFTQGQIIFLEASNTLAALDSISSVSVLT